MASPTNKPPHALVGGGPDAADVRYLTGFSAPDPFLCVQAGRRVHLVVSSLELGRAQALGGKVVCHTAEDLGLTGEHRRGLGRQLIGLLRKLGRETVEVSPRFPLGLARTVEEAGIEVRVRPDPQCPGRIRKTDAEIRHLRAAQRGAVRGLKAGRARIGAAAIGRDGRLRDPDGTVLTSERVRACIERELLECGCHAEELIVAGGDQAVDPHERGHGPLRAGELIILDVFPRAASGYWGDLTRTVLKGEPSPERAELVRTVCRVQTGALRRIRAGVRGADLHAWIVERFERAGYATGRVDGAPQGFIHSTGHGVGLEIHEAPSVSPSGGVLRAGMVVTVEPGLYYPGLGGVRIEDTVVVTRDGCEPLARCTRDWRL